MTSTDAIRQQVEAYIHEHLLEPGATAIDGDADLWEQGLLDSMGLVQLVEFLETGFDVRVPLTILSSAEFMTVDGITHAVSKLRGA